LAPQLSIAATRPSGLLLRDEALAVLVDPGVAPGPDRGDLPPDVHPEPDLVVVSHAHLGHGSAMACGQMRADRL